MARPTALPAADRARLAPELTAATPPAAESASGIGDRSGVPASGSGGRTGTRRPRWLVDEISTASMAIAPSLPAPPAAVKRPWTRSIAACGCIVLMASFSSSVPSAAVMFRETRTSVSPGATSPRQMCGARSSAGRSMAALGSGSVSRCAWWTR